MSTNVQIFISKSFNSFTDKLFVLDLLLEHKVQTIFLQIKCIYYQMKHGYLSIRNINYRIEIKV